MTADLFVTPGVLDEIVAREMAAIDQQVSDARDLEQIAAFAEQRPAIERQVRAWAAECVAAAVFSAMDGDGGAVLQ